MERKDSEVKHKPRNGLKRLRASTGKAPQYKCDNCGCRRYSPCTCKRR